MQAPDVAMTPNIAAAIMFLGMTEGWFTGRKRADYFGSARVGNPFKAHRIITGVDKVEAIKC